MKKIWKALITTAIATVLIVPALAQQAGPTGGGLQNGQNTGQKGAKAGGRGAMLKLNKEVLAKVQPPLTKEQKKQVAGLDKKTMAAMKELREKMKTGDKTQLREAGKKLLEDYKTGLEAILTPAQKTSYQQLYKEALAKALQDRKNGKNGKDGN